jgi:hypothetical protein
MRKLVIIAGLLIAATSAAAQMVVRDPDGNFRAVKTQRNLGAAHDSTTAYTFTETDGTVYPVFKGAKGALYVWKVSKRTGNNYRKYLSDGKK